MQKLPPKNIINIVLEAITSIGAVLTISPLLVIFFLVGTPPYNYIHVLLNQHPTLILFGYLSCILPGTILIIRKPEMTKITILIMVFSTISSLMLFTAP